MPPGETVIELPEPIVDPPQLPLYQTQLAPPPNEPPTILNVVDSPEQIVPGLVVMLVGAIEFAFIEIVTLAQLVVLHVPVART